MAQRDYPLYMNTAELAQLQSCITLDQLAACEAALRETRGGAQPKEFYAESTPVWQSLSDRPRRRGGRR